MEKSFNPVGAPPPMSAYSNASWADGRLLFIAGQVGVAADYQPVGDGGIESQTRQTMENIRIIVEAAGGTMADLVSLVVYVRSMADAPIVNAVRKELLTAPYPSSTMLEVSAFAHPSLLVEISAVASIAT
ncbi:RidA family protein [Sphingobium algorifonticola]|nr:RidA family protein [Sphingobium algorifonticola]